MDKNVDFSMIHIIIKGKDPFPPDYDWLYFDSKNVPFHRVGLQTRFSKKNIPPENHKGAFSFKKVKVIVNREDNIKILTI